MGGSWPPLNKSSCALWIVVILTPSTIQLCPFRLLATIHQRNRLTDTRLQAAGVAKPLSARNDWLLTDGFCLCTDVLRWFSGGRAVIGGGRRVDEVHRLGGTAAAQLPAHPCRHRLPSGLLPCRCADPAHLLTPWPDLVLRGDRSRRHLTQGQFVPYLFRGMEMVVHWGNVIYMWSQPGMDGWAAFFTMG